MDREVELLRGMVELYSPSEQEQDVAKFLYSWMAQSGLHSEIDSAGNAIGSFTPDGYSKTVLFAGHIDVYPGYIPVRIEDDKLYGRGSVDAKGCEAAFLSALIRVKDRLEHTRVIAACCVEEEATTSKGAREIIKKDISPDLVIIGEPSGWDAVTIGYRGVLSFTLKEVQDNLHYGNAESRSVDRIIDQIVNLRSTVEQYRKDTLYDSPSLEIRELNTENDGIVEKATSSVVIRLPPSVGVLQMKQAVTEAVGHTIEFTQADPAYLEDMSSPLISKLRQSIKKYGGKGTMKKKLGTSDSVIIGSHFSVPCIAYGPGDSKLDHTPDEHIEISEYRKAIDVLENFLLSFDGS